MLACFEGERPWDSWVFSVLILRVYRLYCPRTNHEFLLELLYEYKPVKMLAKIRLSGFVFAATVFLGMPLLYRRFMQITFPAKPIFHWMDFWLLGDSPIFADKRLEYANLKLKHWIWRFLANKSESYRSGWNWMKRSNVKKNILLKSFNFTSFALPNATQTCISGLKSHFLVRTLEYDTNIISCFWIKSKDIRYGSPTSTKYSSLTFRWRKSE